MLSLLLAYLLFCPPPCPPPPPPPHHHHEAIALDVLDVLAKTPRLYLVPKLRYSCHHCCPCCCRHTCCYCPPCCCPPPCCPPLSHHHHHEVDALDALAKTPSLHLVPGLRYSCYNCCPTCCCPRYCCPSCHSPPPFHHHHHEADALDELEALTKTSGLYLVPGMRY